MMCKIGDLNLNFFLFRVNLKFSFIKSPNLKFYIEKLHSEPIKSKNQMEDEQTFFFVVILDILYVYIYNDKYFLLY